MIAFIDDIGRQTTERLVQRHQMVYAALGDSVRETAHALSINTLTFQELLQDG